jgi:Phosphate transport (Pho88)
MTQTKRTAAASAPKPKEAGFGQVIKSLLPLALVFGLRSLPFDEEQTLLLSRSVFGIRVTGIVLIACFIAFKIFTLQSTEKVASHEKAVAGGQSELVPELTVQEYDRIHLVDFLKKEAMQAGLILFLHWKFEMVQPMMLSSIMAVLPLFDNELVKSYILGKHVARPFEDKAQESPFAALFAAPVEDKPAAEEKAAAGKKKD